MLETYMYLTQINWKIKELFTNWSGEKAESFKALSASGSYRHYYRIKGKTGQAIGVYNQDRKENKAFFTFTEHFRNNGLNVPDVYEKNIDEGIYLLQDLGDITLFSLLTENKHKDSTRKKVIEFYKQSLEELIKFQVVAGKDLDYSVCYPRASFDRQSMQWDLNYFKYYFLKLTGIQFDEQKLEHDFLTLIIFLSKAETNYFMYRDFQSRNIMIYESQPYFIDYQGGRKGPLQYDIASLLFQAKANLPFDVRESLLDYYIEKLRDFIISDREEFIKYYYGFVLIRTLQVLGAYGFRGYYERKPHFIESIDFALKNVEWYLENVKLPVDIPELNKCLNKMVEHNKQETAVRHGKTLTVEINSFSFKVGIPEDRSGHGGGFVFDCRVLPNPGRYEKYRQFTGLDKPVIDFLSKESAVDKFLLNVFEIADQAVDNYIKRNFDHLAINFGCTGGQHRSVYCAEKLKAHLEKKYDINIVLNHKMKKM